MRSNFWFQYLKLYSPSGWAVQSHFLYIDSLSNYWILLLFCAMCCTFFLNSMHHFTWKETAQLGVFRLLALCSFHLKYVTVINCISLLKDTFGSKLLVNFAHGCFLIHKRKALSSSFVTRKVAVKVLFICPRLRPPAALTVQCMVTMCQLCSEALQPGGSFRSEHQSLSLKGTLSAGKKCSEEGWWPTFWITKEVFLL